VEKFWGKHAYLTEVTDLLSNLREAKNQVNLTQSHTNCQMSMTAKDLIGVILLDETLDIIHPVTKTVSSTLSLRDVLLHYLKISDGHSMIAEAHQEELLKPTTIIIPITAKAERMSLMMNNNIPPFLWHMLRDQGMPEDFIKDLLGKSCKASLVANVYKCTWDQTTRTLTTKEEEEKDKEIKAFESAPWFRDEFGFLGKNKDQGKNKYLNPKSLFYLNGNKSYKMIHDRHKVPKDQVGTPPRVNNAPKKKTVIEVEGSDKDTSKDNGDSEGSEDTGSEEKEEEATNRDSASQMSSNSKNSNDSSNKGLCPKGSKGVVNTRSNKEAMGVAGRG
jgi:hypothetical protein